MHSLPGHKGHSTHAKKQAQALGAAAQGTRTARTTSAERPASCGLPVRNSAALPPRLQASLLQAPHTQALLRVLLLLLICTLAVAIRLFPAARFGRTLHAYHPYLHLRAAKQLLDGGRPARLGWTGLRRWYPLEQGAASSVRPGVSATAALVTRALQQTGGRASLHDVCVFLPPAAGALSAVLAYCLAREVAGAGTGLLAAAFMATAPGYVQVTVSGSLDERALGTCALLATLLSYLRAMRTGSLRWSVSAVVAYLYLAACWRASALAATLLPTHVLAMLAVGRCPDRMYATYSVMFVLAALLAVQVPALQVLQLPEHMLATAAFVTLQVSQLVRQLRAMAPHQQRPLTQHVLRAGFTAGAAAVGLLLLAGAGLNLLTAGGGRTRTAGGQGAAVARRLAALPAALWHAARMHLDPTFLNTHDALGASIAERQPAAWGNFFLDAHLMAFLAPAGLRHMLRATWAGSDASALILAYALACLYLAGVQVRNMVLAVPPLALLAAAGLSSLLAGQARLLVRAPAGRPRGAPDKKLERRQAVRAGLGQPFRHQRAAACATLAGAALLLAGHMRHAVWAARAAYSTPAILVPARTAAGEAIVLDDFREAYAWLRDNTPPDARVLAWWDYGHQLAALARRTALVDGAFANSTRVAEAARLLVVPEEDAAAGLRALGVGCVMVVFGGETGYGGDDLNKLQWMLRIAADAFPGDVDPASYLGKQGDAAGTLTFGAGAPPALTGSLLYRLSYFRFGGDQSQPFDKARQVEVPAQQVELQHFTEAFTSENWLVRIYQLRHWTTRH